MPQRKRGLPISSSRQPAPKLKSNAAFWAGCETAYGQAISSEIRDEIVVATNNFLWFASIEPEAAKANEAAKRIGQWKKAASKLLSAQTEPGSTATIFYAEYLVQNEFPITLDQFHDLLMSYSAACTRAQSRATSKDEPEFRSGGSWDVWIRRLMAILKQHGFPITVRHDDEGRPSRFLHLVRELQKGFPAQYRRGARSDEATGKALETAIGRARGSQKPPKSD